MKDIRVKSQGGLFPHAHTLVVPGSAFVNPPKEGITLTTTPEYSLVFKHSHEVHVSHDDLVKLGAGAEVTVKDTDKGRHSFVLRAV